MDEQQNGTPAGPSDPLATNAVQLGSLDARSTDTLTADQSGYPGMVVGSMTSRTFVERFKIPLVGVLLFLLLAGGLTALIRSGSQSATNTLAGDFQATQVPLDAFASTETSNTLQTVTVDGQLRVNHSIVLKPTAQPLTPEVGQLYYDINTNQLTYYNGTQFLGLASGTEALQTSTTNLITNITTGGITTSGGTTNRLGKFTGAQSMGDSIASDEGTFLQLEGGLNINAQTTVSDFSLWTDATVPGSPNFVDVGGPVELGVKFKTDVAGSITGLRFYRGTSSVGPYVGSLWSNTGGLLAQATFSVSSTGWQEIIFPTAITISPDTTYIASYHTGGGGYATDANFFGTGGVDSGPLHALADGVDGGNGVYRYNATSIFPTQTSSSSNYWIDVIFSGTTYTDDSRIRINGTQLSSTDLINDSDLAKRGSSQVFTGNNVFRKASNGDSVFEVQRADTTRLFSVDSTNARVIIGPIDGSSGGIVLVLNRKTGSTSDPPGTNGAIYYHNELEMFRCYRDGEWAECGGITAPRGFNLYEEFMGGQTTSFASNNIGNLGWTAQAIGANGSLSFNPTTPAPAADRPGVLAVQTPAVANQGTTFTLADSAAPSMIIGAGNTLRTAVAIGATTNQVLRVGLDTQTTTTTQPVSGVWWEADPSASTNWRYCYGTGVAAVCANTSVALTANSWVRMEIRVLTTGTGTSSATFFINSASFTVSSVTIDTTGRISPALSCYTTTGATRDCYWDYFQLRGTTSAAR